MQTRTREKEKTAYFLSELQFQYLERWRREQGNDRTGEALVLWIKREIFNVLLKREKRCKVWEEDRQQEDAIATAEMAMAKKKGRNGGVLVCSSSSGNMYGDFKMLAPMYVHMCLLLKAFCYFQKCPSLSINASSVQTPFIILSIYLVVELWLLFVFVFVMKGIMEGTPKERNKMRVGRGEVEWSHDYINCSFGGVY